MNGKVCVVEIWILQINSCKYQGGYTILLCALIGYWFDDTSNQKTVQNKDDQIPYSDWIRDHPLSTYAPRGRGKVTQKRT